ncbi:MAG: GuaB3 family IMP dehydrogenase-related protein [Dehalococcoidia bacterium]|nr:GuaB3 family IMP dehydrogenase-related protein [Dehalococcoidia bacterium]
MGVPQFKEIHRAYGFDEISIVPGPVTVNPDQVDPSFKLGSLTLKIPFLASAMDAVVGPRFAVLMHQMGGLGVMNLEGLQTRYDNAEDVLERIRKASQEEATPLLQKLYAAPLKEELIGRRVREIKEQGAVCAVSITPQNTKRFAPLAVEAGADIIVVQSTVTTARHVSKSYRGLIFSEFMEAMKVPVIVGNCATYDAARELMETGIDGVLVGVGPGAACTTREVVGVGVPQVTATLDCAAAREEYFHRTGRYVAVITDGGMRTGGDICKAIVSGADAVMLGTTFAQTEEAPGRGYNWGMATSHLELPRGTRVTVGTQGTLKQILYGPTSVTNGTQNLVNALKVGMGMLGAFTIRDFQQAELTFAPAIKTEGKHYQLGF